MIQKQRRSQRVTIDLEQLKQDSNSFLALNPDDEVLQKLEMVRLYQVGYAPEDIVTAFGYVGRTYFCSPFGANLSTLQACPEPVEGIHLMLRAAVLLSFLRRLQRFSTSGHPEALVACYAAA